MNTCVRTKDVQRIYIYIERERYIYINMFVTYRYNKADLLACVVTVFNTALMRWNCDCNYFDNKYHLDVIIKIFSF